MGFRNNRIKKSWERKRGSFRPRIKGGSMTTLKWKGKKVGYYYGKTFLTYRNDFQIMQKFNSFGISLEVLEKLRKLKIMTLVIKYQGVLGKFKFITSLDDWFDSRIEYTDEENDLQKHLKIDYIQKVEW